ncbi:MAG: biopolymer transporter ExbD [Burkholderiaceae bacterium]|nr:biopolymer transporter ExbD [Burkholderiaceae bacterium]
MGMNVGSGGGGDAEPMMDINMTPMIDVMLVLLIMLVTTIPIQMHSVNLNLPVGTPPPPVKPPVVHTISIDFDGTMDWDGEPVPDRANLESRLMTVAAEPDQDEVHVRPNKLVPYRDVAKVMASAQRLGVTKIGMVGNEQFVQ